MELLGLDVRRADHRTGIGKRLAQVLTMQGVRHVVDVGANVGQFGRMIRDEARFTGRLDSFEPASEPYAHLAAAASGGWDWHTHHVALSDSTGTAEMLTRRDSSLNSLARTTAAGDELFSGWQSGDADVETISTVTLDSLDLPDVGPAFLKLDTQGHDFAVIDGATGFLSRCALVMVELSFVELYESSVHMADGLRRMEALGFSLIDMFPVTRSEQNGLTLIEADGLFGRP